MGIGFKETISENVLDICENLGSTVDNKNLDIKIPIVGIPRQFYRLLENIPSEMTIYQGKQTYVLTCALQDTIDRVIIHPRRSSSPKTLFIQKNKAKSVGEQITVPAIVNSIEGVLFDTDIPQTPTNIKIPTLP